jgi:NADH-quinone oxidoreductase subunit C
MSTENSAAGADSSTSVILGPGMANPSFKALVAQFPYLALRAGSQAEQDWVIVPVEGLKDVLGFLRTDPGSDFRMLLDVTAVDLLPRVPRWEVVYSLLSLTHNRRYRVKVELADVEVPTVPSISLEWAAANFYEREVYDLLGITFSGHPDMRRLLLPDDWVGHPLRYDHPVGGEDVSFTS